MQGGSRALRPCPGWRRVQLPRLGPRLAGNPACCPTPPCRACRREVTIVDADAFTREQAAARGAPLAPAQPVPVNPIEQALAAKSKPSGKCWVVAVLGPKVA